MFHPVQITAMKRRDTDDPFTGKSREGKSPVIKIASGTLAGQFGIDVLVSYEQFLPFAQTRE
jgi:hypothetical protein